VSPKKGLIFSLLFCGLLLAGDLTGTAQTKVRREPRRPKRTITTRTTTLTATPTTIETPPPPPPASLAGSWVQVGTGGGGRFQSIDFSPVPNALGAYTAYLGGDTCGLYKSEDNGTTWIPINNGLYDHRTSAVAVSPADPSTLYAATSGGLFKSTDGGAAWTPVLFGRSFSVSQRNNALASIALNPADPSMILIGTGNLSTDAPLWDGSTGIYLSPDGGSTWSRVYSTSNFVVYAIAMNPNRPGSVYAALANKNGSGRLIHSENLGHAGTWVEADAQHAYYDLGFDQANHLFAAGGTGTSGSPYVIRIDDVGAVVSPLVITPPQAQEKPRSTSRIAVSPQGTVYVGDRLASNPTIWRFQNGQWSSLSQYDKTQPGWADFTDSGNPRGTTYSLSVAPDGKPWHGGSMQLFRWEDLVWRQKYTQRTSFSNCRTRGNSSTTIFSRDMVFVSPSEYYWGPADIYIEGTSSGGADYTRVKFPDPDGRMNDARVFVADSQDPRVWYVSTHLQDQKANHAKLLKKAVDGTWQIVLTTCRLDSACPFTNPTIPNGGGIMDVSARGNSILVSTYNEGVYRSTDGGMSWNKVTGLGINVVQKFSRSLIETERLMAAVSSGSKGVWASDDDGATWRQVRTATRSYMAVAWGGAATWYASEGPNIFRTRDNGATWESVYTWQARPDAFANRLPDANDISVGIVNPYNPAENPVAANFCVMGYFDHSIMGGVAASLGGGSVGTWRQLPLNGVTYFGWGVEFNPYDPFELFYLTYGSGVYKTRLQ